jgi:hypothetical protein
VAQLLEPADLRDRERLVDQVAERIAVEQRERLARRAPRLPRRGRAAGLRDEPFEATHVHALPIDPQLVAAPVGQDLRAAAVGERLAQPPDVVLHHLGGALRRLLAPQSLDQPVGGDGAIGLEPQHRQDRPLLRSAEGHRMVVDAGLEVSKDADLHGTALVVVLVSDQPCHLSMSRSTTCMPAVTGPCNTAVYGRSTPPARPVYGIR